MSAIFVCLNFASLTTVYVEPKFSTLKRVLPEKIRRFDYVDSWSESNTTCEYIILFKRCSLGVSTCFGLLF